MEQHEGSKMVKFLFQQYFLQSYIGYKVKVDLYKVKHITGPMDRIVYVCLTT